MRDALDVPRDKKRTKGRLADCLPGGEQALRGTSSTPGQKLHA